CVPGDPVQTLAHELGHLLTLGHGDGEDNNGDAVPPPAPGGRWYDAWCDPLLSSGGLGAQQALEDTMFPLAASSVMVQLASSTHLSEFQIEQGRDAAKLVPGAVFDAANDPAGLVMWDGPCDPFACGIPEELALLSFLFARTPGNATTGFVHQLAGAVPDGVTVRYAAFIDTDHDASTGGAPAALGFATSFQGAEVISQVDVTGASGAWT